MASQLFCATTDDHRSEMILSTRSAHPSPGLVDEALSIRWAQPLCNIAVLAAVIGNPNERHRTRHLLRRRASSQPCAHLPRVGAMSGLLHPVGPESVRIYWVRR